MTNGTVLVASPRAIGRQPEASGSSVPAWPARLARNRRLITDTAWVDVMPTGLSSTTQPCTSNFSRLRCFPPSPACGGGPGRGPVSFIVVGPLFVAGLEAALHARGVQQLLDARGLLEPLVDAEADVGRELHVDAMGDLAAQVALVALERLDHRLLVAPAERHHVDGGELEVRRHAHLGHRDDMALDDGIMHLAARQDVGDGVTDHLAGAQCALARSRCGLPAAVAMMAACHVMLP